MLKQDLRRTGKVMLTVLGCSLASHAKAGAQEATNITPKQLALEAVANETKVIEYSNGYLRYQVHTLDAKGDQVRQVVETRDGTVARVLRRGDRALTTQEDADEQARLQQMLASPDAFQRHVQKDKTGKKLALDLLSFMPTAMIFSYAPGQPQRGNKPPNGPNEIVIDFKPDPRWSPPTMVAEALTGLEGRCWIDVRTHYLTRMEADLFQAVNVGLGFFAHLYPGGKFVVEQVPVGDGRWIVDHFTEHVTVRAMMVKTLKQDVELSARDFTAIPAMGYQEAIKQLLAK